MEAVEKHEAGGGRAEDGFEFGLADDRAEGERGGGERESTRGLRGLACRRE